MSNPIVESLNTKYISIVPENGEVFNPGQKIIYNIEPNIGFMKRDSYMIFDILNNTANFSRMQLSPLAGIHSIVENIRIYSKQTGVLLESCENYGQIQALINQYGFDDRSDLEAKEGVGNPCMAKLNATGGGQVTSTQSSRHPTNSMLSPVDPNGNPMYVSTRYIMSLRCGIFRYFDAERLIPILNFGGLRIEINLQTPDLALVQQGCSTTNAALVEGHLVTDLINTGAPMAAKAAGANANIIIGGFCDTQNCGFAVGNTVRYVAPAGGGQAAVDITRTVNVIGDDGAGNITITLSGANIAQTNAGTLRVVNATPSYQVTGTEFRICQVVPTQKQANDLRQNLNYEFTTWDLFLDNIPAASLRHQVPINSVASKALAIISIPYLANNERNLNHQHYYAGDTPTGTLINSVQFFINNRLYPLRNYNPQTTADRVLNLNESVKSMKAIGLSPLCLGRNKGPDLDNYNQTFILSRELARNGFVFDLRNAEAEIRLGLTAARANIIRVNTFVFSKKIIETTEAGVAVIL